MNLTIDIGNSTVKAALFDGGRIVRLIDGFENLPVADKTIFVSTRGDEVDIEGALRFDSSTPVPLKNLYGTPATLGGDRLAAAVGAATMFPAKNVLVVDFGTAITYDVVTAAGEFLGGNISPGAGCRFRALHEFTGKLPLGALPDSSEFPARTTKEAIESGVVTGIIAETEHYIGLAKEKWGEIEIIFTGRDAEYFAERVKIPIFTEDKSSVKTGCGSDNCKQGLHYRSPYTIFAVSDLVFRGLNAILEHNANS